MSVYKTIPCFISSTAAVILNTGRVKTQRISCTQQTIVEINRTVINLSESFIVFEAHSQWYNLSVSFLPQREYGQYENGTNIGVIVVSILHLPNYSYMIKKSIQEISNNFFPV